MDYSATWLSSASLVVKNSDNTLRLFDESPVRESIKPKLINTGPAPEAGPGPRSSPPMPSNEVASKLRLKDETVDLMEELNRVNAENKRLTEMLTVVCENYNDLKRQLVDYMSKSCSNEINNANKKRKVENSSNGNNNNGVIVKNNGDTSSSDEEDSYDHKPKEETIKAKITRVAVRTQASDSTLILKDGYQWRKYGQKVTRDNPCPRAYFKCSFAPSCPVKKKVQRSLEDQSMLVATYEGEHNHPQPAQQEGGAGTVTAPSSSSRSIVSLSSVPSNGSNPTVTLDLTKPKSNVTKCNNVHDFSSTNTNKMFNNTLNQNQVAKFSSPEFQKLLAEQMASSLTKDPNFTAALAAAITGRFVQQSSSD
ncbi:probable WRKY transcription factor 40 [Amaranthus tricolor]|uniref:probable WRKY transcription factor 40 n=1 Tax=Amaranthus tricolor TaxID=29722 RepID=UPI0025879BD2|nr:probable WRKY transcription factor 40 [Amaranthus tricolor]